jgi:hypothetical protein
VSNAKKSGEDRKRKRKSKRTKHERNRQNVRSETNDEKGGKQK